MSAADKRRSRGQAVVESSLGILIFVTIFLFGMHFAEVTFSQMKVTEAAQAALWDSTAGQMHTLPLLLPFTQNFNIVKTGVAAAVADVNTRYADFEGRSLVPNGPAPKQVMSSVRPGSLNVACSVGGVMNQKGAFIIPLGVYELLAYTDNGGIKCTSEAYIDPFGTMKMGNFLEDANGFFKAKQRQSAAVSTGGYHVCGVNKPNGFNGPCTGEFGGLIDDWGMAQTEDGTCPVIPYGLPCPTNVRFWTTANAMYVLNSLLWQTQNNADKDIVELVDPPPVWAWFGIQGTPGHPTSFYMNAAGEDTAFLGFAWAGDLSAMLWWTTPMGWVFLSHSAAFTAAKINGSGYLGKKVNISTIGAP